MFNKRSSMSIADRFLVNMKTALWTDWSVSASVKEGYKVSGWVYAAIRHIVQAASNIELIVYKDGEPLPQHPLSMLFKRPCRSLSSQDFLELIIAWLQLTGRAPFKKIKVGSRTKELQLISPDRIAPIPSPDIDFLVAGYEIDGTRIPEQDITSICYLRLIDPANPLQGISPLMAAARDVDCDHEQQEWNKSAMQNRGVVDGVFTFKKDLTQTVGDTILAKIKEKFGSRNAVREPLVLGSEASYTRIGLNAAEMDFIESRKFNRESIFVTFNVPLALVSSDSMTYNNYNSAMRILYESNIIPLMDDICSELNFSFDDELAENEEIRPDLTNVAVLREQDDAKIANAKILYEIGVPMSEINDRLELGLNKYSNWDIPWSGFPPRQAQSIEQRKKDIKLVPFEQRDINAEIQEREDVAEKDVMKMFNDLLIAQREAVRFALENGKDPVAAIKATHGDWVEALDNKSRELAIYFSQRYATNSSGGALNREMRANVTDAIKAYLVQEAYALNEVALIEKATAAGIVAMVQNGIAKDQTVGEIAQAIDDVSLFSPERSLRLARTLTGTAQSIGQLGAALAVGATEKTWLTAGDENVRSPLHTERDGVTVPIDGEWTNGPLPMRFPLDPHGDAGDRINCRCTMTFK